MVGGALLESFQEVLGIEDVDYCSVSCWYNDDRCPGSLVCTANEVIDMMTLYQVHSYHFWRAWPRL